MVNKKLAVEPQERRWILWRRHNDKQTLMFVLTVNIEEDPKQKGFSATINELPGGIIAVERTGVAAEARVLRAFQDVVDHCLNQGRDRLDAFISEADSGIMDTLDFSFDEVKKQTTAALKKLEKLDQDSKPWIASLAEAA